jgi:surfactin synthase thioesterase subunit
VTAFCGTGDVLAPKDTVAAWSRHAAAGFSLQELPGDHFFLRSRGDQVVARIRGDLAA